MAALEKGYHPARACSGAGTIAKHRAFECLTAFIASVPLHAGSRRAYLLRYLLRSARRPVHPPFYEACSAGSLRGGRTLPDQCPSGEIGGRRTGAEGQGSQWARRGQPPKSLPALSRCSGSRPSSPSGQGPAPCLRRSGHGTSALPKPWCQDTSASARSSGASRCTPGRRGVRRLGRRGPSRRPAHRPLPCGRTIPAPNRCSGRQGGANG